MAKFVTPRVFLIGKPTIDAEGLLDYLEATDNTAFLEAARAASAEGVSAGEVLCSFFAKLCYASLSLGKNDNVTKVRDIPDNIKATLAAGHGSVFEHVMLNFVATDVSRVLTHELVRHRAGTAFSQTSGRYVRGESVNLILDPILDPVKDDAADFLLTVEDFYNRMVKKLGLNDKSLDMGRKKKLTSALRRFLPNGQSNEIGFSLNLRTLRHTVMVRTSRHAEWEIREVFGQVYRLVKKQMPLIFSDAVEEVVGGALEVTGMRLQPYEVPHGG